MRAQTGLLAQDHSAWILVTDSDEDEPERAWKDLDAALKELAQEGWVVVQGPAKIRPDPEFIGIERFEPLGYRLRRGIQ
jgi:hypothetical protein